MHSFAKGGSGINAKKGLSYCQDKPLKYFKSAIYRLLICLVRLDFKFAALLS